MSAASVIAAGAAASVYFAMPMWRKNFRVATQASVASYDNDYYYWNGQSMEQDETYFDPVPDVIATTSTTSTTSTTVTMTFVTKTTAPPKIFVDNDNVTPETFADTDNMTSKDNETFLGNMWRQHAPDWIPSQGVTVSLPWMFIITVLMAEFGRAAVAYFMFAYCRKRVRLRTVMCNTMESFTAIREEVDKRIYHSDQVNADPHYECKRCNSVLSISTKCVKRNDSERWTHLCSEFASGFESFEVIK
jgi:hypothetical protein